MISKHLAKDMLDQPFVKDLPYFKGWMKLILEGSAWRPVPNGFNAEFHCIGKDGETVCIMKEKRYEEPETENINN